VFRLYERLAIERYHLLADAAGSNSTPVSRVDLAGPIGETIRLKCVKINKEHAAEGVHLNTTLEGDSCYHLRLLI